MKEDECLVSEYFEKVLGMHTGKVSWHWKQNDEASGEQSFHRIRLVRGSLTERGK